MQSAVDRGAGDGEDLGEVGDGVLASAVHPHELALLLGRELGLLATQLPPGLSHGHAFLRPSPQEVNFELGEGGQDVEEHLSHRVGRVVDLSAEGELDAAFGQRVADGASVRAPIGPSRSSFGTASGSP
ncbi:hypothetical protein GCM10027563_27950 [Parasphingorhabdus pacifica]